MNNVTDIESYNKKKLDETKIRFKNAYNKIILIFIVLVLTLNPIVIIFGVILEQIVFIVLGILSSIYGIVVIIYFIRKINRILKLNDEEIFNEKWFQKFLNSKANNN